MKTPNTHAQIFTTRYWGSDVTADERVCGYVTCVLLILKLEGKPVGSPRRRWHFNIKQLSVCM